MAFSCGFYNSVNHDRVYDAVQFGEMFDGLINDGVYATVGNAMNVYAQSGMTVCVQSGRAWFNKTWSVNTTDYRLTIPVADVLLPRIDAVVLEVDTRLQTRNNNFKIIKGSPANSPSKPTLIRANGVYQYPLAWVTVPANAKSLTNGNIEIQVGRSPTPYVTGVVSSVDITQLYNSWEKEFRDWFDEIKGVLNSGGDNILSLTSRVITLEGKVTSLESKVNSIPSEASTNDLSLNGNRPTKKYISPSVLLFWWSSTIDTSGGIGAKADVEDILNPSSERRSDIKYISPTVLKQAFPELYNGNLSAGFGSNITTTVLNATDCSTTFSSVTFLDGKIRVLKSGRFVMIILEGISIRSSVSTMGFNIQSPNIPLPNRMESGHLSSYNGVGQISTFPPKPVLLYTDPYNSNGGVGVTLLDTSESFTSGIFNGNLFYITD